MKVQNFGNGLLITEADGKRTAIRRSEVVAILEQDGEVNFEMKSGTVTQVSVNDWEESDLLFRTALNFVFGEI